ncbi:MAG TPA: hypothetical protein DEB23_06180 [Chitinophagaceae bacterium]|nr:hypothetical protein [Chitinophagaceae bacterium]
MSKRRVFDYKSKYGFNSAEKHNELDNLDGLDYDLGARFYSSKLGRMFSPDPRESEYPWQSTYAYFSNSPISQVDINGEGGEGDKTTGQVTATVYFRFDSDVSLTPSQQQAYIDNFRANVQSVWNNQVLDNGVQVNVDNVQFLLAPATLTSASLLKNENLLTVGNGATANKDAEANVSYIDKNNHRNTGYMYYSFQGNEAAHEFGHMLGLSDRYFNGVIIDVAHFYRNGGESSINRFTIPIADINENGYNYLNNLMSRQSGNPLLTANQLNIAFNSNAKEEDYAKFSVVHSLTSVTTNGYDGLSIDGKNYYSQGNRKGYPPLTTYTKNNLQGLNSIDPMFLQRDTKNFILNNRTW